MTQIPVPEKLNLNADNACRNWESFKQAWMNYEIAVDLEEQSDKKRLATFLTIIGAEAMELYNTFQWNADETKNLTNVLRKFEDYCKPKKNQTYERYIFLTLKQSENEGITEFVTKLRT